MMETILEILAAATSHIASAAAGSLSFPIFYQPECPKKLRK